MNRSTEPAKHDPSPVMRYMVRRAARLRGTAIGAKPQARHTRPGSLTLLLGVLTWSAALAGLTLAIPAARAGYAQRPEARALIDQVVGKHGLRRQQVIRLLNDAHHQKAIISAITRPAESLPWYRYRAIFLQPDRIQEGADFMARHGPALRKAQAQYGVPAPLITAIIGVETRYGRHLGTYRVIDALATLGFDYPKRGQFFRSELAQFLILSREAHFDPLRVKGSYAGAMGLPQFIASSYRHYAVDFNHDGRTDLWQQPMDAIGSVANYLAKNGWQRGAPVAYPAVVDHPGGASLKASPRKPAYSLARLARAHVQTNAKMAPDTAAGLLIFQDHDHKEYWAGLHNFYVITTYNRSPLYAMAVYQLSQAIAAAKPDVAER